MADGSERSIYRHRLPVRIMHWINVVCLFALLMSGLQIFNAHPALYWGEYSTFDKPWLALTAQRAADGQLRGDTQVGSLHVTTTGVLGVSAHAITGRPQARGFPSWATIPAYRSLAEGRRWHFFFAWLFVINGLAYLLWSWRSRHMGRDLLPTVADWKGMGHSIVEHLKFRHPTGQAATRYNILQKLAYLAVVLALGPGVVLMGMAMSPHLDSVLSWLVDLVGGRQSARTIHFLIAMAFVGFILVHVFMVLVTGPINQVRAMITGRYRYHDDPPPESVPAAASGVEPSHD